MRALGRLARTVINVGAATAFRDDARNGLAPTDAAAATCALSILNCGCTINAPGNYTLSGASPMNSTGTCINITASNVTLSSSGIVIKGPGSVPGTIGVYIAPTANKVILEGHSS